ncbi:uncharacterized protein LOC111260283 [Varroa jacobsoni]|uniref:Uncharacterized protein n=1 Tax=Varroa destructor TaxID=109461 RepID=A0A7M7L6T5_VARDE|nr:uncharacterized protein LOC111254777 [Varroa destructor]XP_022671705.1 uncharacterized protein LOC111254777 [Varroa destructor]XP_022671706.1 uncharacterized protein LOC111254777 [Varroa destructor]XP_022671707.1 uncharacterized protein LOC111254777 [Varroa destructor]XP_022671708.1 uncharacterized protein LOC111254777 [Varroa destructor]XP_022671709.1 uncharacterized protein LOC111254777 [Varroa destructor]XP_022671710.1 uncharacterized protein LOC111254777 [Varroa destructor]XP_02267171
MAVAFQDDFETVQSLAEQMIYKEPFRPPEPVEDGELIDSDTDGLNHRQYKSPLECGFKQTEAKPAIFYKILCDEDIRIREQIRIEKRRRIAQEVSVFVKAEHRPIVNELEQQRRRIPNKNEIEFKERRMREVIFNELKDMWRSGHYIDRPENVHPFIRGDSGEFSEERALRRRLFRGCFREFVNDCRNPTKRNNLGMSYPTSPYGDGHHHYHQSRIPDSHFRNRERHHHDYRHGPDRSRSVLESITWTAEEVRLYYECMAKYNVRPVLPIRHTRTHAMPNVSDNMSYQSQDGFDIAFAEHSRRRHYGRPYKGRERDYRSSLEPENGSNRLIAYHNESASPQPESYSTLPLTPSTSHDPTPPIRDDASNEMVDATDECKAILHSQSPQHLPADLSPTSSGVASTPPLNKDSATIFVDELQENANSEPAQPTNGETGEIDLYDDL